MGDRADDGESRRAASCAVARPVGAGAVRAVAPQIRHAAAGRGDNTRRRNCNGLKHVLDLPTVTLLTVDTVNHALALRALARSTAQIRFAHTLLLTSDLPHSSPVQAGVEVRSIEPIRSRDSYSSFVLKQLASYVETPHV